MNKEKLLEFYKAHSGEIIGTFIGALFGIFVITVGFWKTVFVGLCAFIGYYIGKKISNDEIVELLDKILPPGKIQ